MPRGTTLRNVRVADPLWAAALAVAEQRDETVSDVIRAALERYVKRYGITPPPD
jgi:antitoxin component of RelBE/YafQ-DinJ toxin-antitoxin module